MAVCIYFAIVFVNLAMPVALDAYLRGSLAAETTYASSLHPAVQICINAKPTQSFSLKDDGQLYKDLTGDGFVLEHEYYSYLARYVTAPINKIGKWRNKIGLPKTIRGVSMTWLMNYREQVLIEKRKAIRKFKKKEINEISQDVKMRMKPIIDSLALAMCVMNRFSHEGEDYSYEAEASRPNGTAADKSDLIWYWLCRAAAAFLNAQALHYAGTRDGQVAMKNVFRLKSDILNFVHALLSVLKEEAELYAYAQAEQGDPHAVQGYVEDTLIKLFDKAMKKIEEGSIAEGVQLFDDAGFIRLTSSELS